METGRSITLDIETMAYGGDGVGRHEGMVVFVPFTCDGDRLEVEIVQVKKTFVRARVTQLIIPSSHRVTPPCRYYGSCGGCCYQHIEYTHQLELKRKQVEDAFVRIGKVDNPPVRDTVGSPLSYHYRGKADFHVRKSKGSRPAIGFIDVMQKGVLDIEHCEIVDESINQVLSRIRTVPAGSAQEKRTIVWSAEDAGPSSQKGCIARTVKDKTLLTPVDGFFQANGALVGKLVDEVISACALSGVETVIDAYCGCGLFTLFLAAHAGRVLGIEENKEAVAAAQSNAEREGLDNATFVAGDVAEILRSTQVGSEIDAVVLDPPRTGCDVDALSSLIELKPQRICYISCNPTTQARDCRYLLDAGYRLRYLQPLDMFPQTGHIEVVGLLEKSVT